MSVRVYTGPRQVHRGPSGLARALPWFWALATIGLQIAYPLVEGDARDVITIATVLAFFLASATHAVVWRGVGWTAGFLLVTVGGGLAVEAIGLRTGFPFGDYTYADTLGPSLFGVPLVVPLAWAMMAYPALLVARRLARGTLAAALIGAWALATWGLFLDPMMVGDGHWTWSGDFVEIPGIDGIPLSNFLGWLLTAFVMMLLLALLPRIRADDAQPYTLFVWTWFSSTLGAAVFFDRPWVAVIGGIGMGLVAVPLLWSLWLMRD